MRPSVEKRVPRAAKESMWHRASVQQVRCVRGIYIDRDKHFTGFTATLALDSCEKGSPAIIVIHRPAIERMVVALGALSADAHGELCNVLP